MFTNNYVLYHKSLFFNQSQTYKGFDGSSVGYSSGDLYPYGLGSQMFPRCKALKASTSSSGVYFGTGRTAAQRTDITLENVITSGLSATYSSVATANPSPGVYEVMSAFVVTNTSAEDITIGEVGYFLCFGGNTAPVLMERTVLASPITIAPGAAKVITYKLVFNHG